jgi:tetratricopeptide (TPR) repeat protein
MLRADDAETMTEHSLRDILARQKVLLEDAARAGDNRLDQDSVKTQLNSLSEEYKSLIAQSPDFAPAYADYGYFLGKLHLEDEAMKILLKADQLDPTIPMVKNQLGNTLAESGKPLDALSYFQAAARLNPGEPLYPYQIGTLLYEARDTFLGPGRMSRQQWDQQMQSAFRTAAELAPDRIEFTYRYAESYFDVTAPDWNEAYGKWAALEAKATSPADRQILELQEARVRIYQGRIADAREILAKVTDPDLAQQKQKLVAQLPENAKK